MIYFLRSGENGPIKIGFSATRQSIPQRIELLQCGNPERLYILAITEGSLQDEYDLHANFAEDSLIGEWFRPSERLMEFISGHTEDEPIPTAKLQALARFRECEEIASLQTELRSANSRIEALVSRVLTMEYQLEQYGYKLHGTYACPMTGHFCRKAGDGRLSNITEQSAREYCCTPNDTPWIEVALRAKRK